MEVNVEIVLSYNDEETDWKVKKIISRFLYRLKKYRTGNRFAGEYTYKINQDLELYKQIIEFYKSNKEDVEFICLNYGVKITDEEFEKAMADLKNSTGRADELTHRVETLQAELEAAKANAEKLQKAGAIQSDADIAVFQSFFQAVQENFNRACGLMQKVKTRDAEKAAKLARFSRDALAKMAALVEKAGCSGTTTGGITERNIAFSTMKIT